MKGVEMKKEVMKEKHLKTVEGEYTDLRYLNNNDETNRGKCKGWKPWTTFRGSSSSMVLSLQTMYELFKLPSVLFRNKAKKTKVSQGRTSLDLAKGITCSGAVIYDQAITSGEKYHFEYQIMMCYLAFPE